MSRSGSPVGRLAYAPLTSMLGGLNVAMIARLVASAACFMEHYDVERTRTSPDDAHVAYYPAPLTTLAWRGTGPLRGSPVTKVTAPQPSLSPACTPVPGKHHARAQPSPFVDDGGVIHRLHAASRCSPLDADRAAQDLLTSVNNKEEDGLSLLTVLAQMGLALPSVTSATLLDAAQLDRRSTLTDTTTASYTLNSLMQLMRIEAMDEPAHDTAASLSRSPSASARLSRLERMRMRQISQHHMHPAPL